METPFQAPLTPEQIAAIDASGGFAHCEDPTNQISYHLVQDQPPTLDDDYVREKIEEAYADAAASGVGHLDMAAVKAEFQQKLARHYH